MERGGEKLLARGIWKSKGGRMARGDFGDFGGEKNNAGSNGSIGV